MKIRIYKLLILILISYNCFAQLNTYDNNLPKKKSKKNQSSSRVLSPRELAIEGIKAEQNRDKVLYSKEGQEAFVQSRAQSSASVPQDHLCQLNMPRLYRGLIASLHHQASSRTYAFTQNDNSVNLVIAGIMI